MTTGERMKFRRKQIGLSAEKVADMLNVSPATIYRYENGDIEKVPGNRLEPIAEALCTTASYLMGWSNDPSPVSAPIENVLPVPNLYAVPLVGTIACGAPILADENKECDIFVPEHIHADFALRCKGDSMIGADIVDGDIVYIRQQEEVLDGQIAAVLIEDEATLKRVYYDKQSSEITLVAENPKIRPMVYRGEQLNHIRILGRAVGLTRSLDN